MNLKVSLIGTGILAIATIKPAIAKQNPFSNMILTSITVETNLDGKKISKNIHVKSFVKKQYKEDPQRLAILKKQKEYALITEFEKSPWLTPPYYSTNITKTIQNDELGDIKGEKYFIPKINGFDPLKKTGPQTPATKDSHWRPDLKYHDTLFRQPEESIIFKKIPEAEINKDIITENKNLKDTIKKLTSVKISKNTIVSSLNYNLTKDFTVNAQWQVEKPSKSPSVFKKYLSDNTVSDKAVSLYSFAVNMFF